MPPRFLRTLIGLLLPLAVCLLARAQVEADADGFVVTTASGKSIRGPIHALGADWSLQVGKGGRRTVAGEDVVSIRRAGVALPPLPTDEQLILANGDTLPARGVRLDGEKLSFVHPDLEGGKASSIPLEAVAVLWRTPPDGINSPEQFRRRLASGSRSRDQVLLHNGDLLEGTLNTLDQRNVEVEADKKTRSARINQVSAVALSTELAERVKPKGLYARLVLTPTERSPGGRLTLVSARSDGSELQGKTSFGASVRVPWDRVAALDLMGGRAVYLSHLPPTKYEYHPYLDERWSWSADGTVTGREMRVAGSTFDKGVSMHSHSQLTWKLAGPYQRFEAEVGLDDRDGRNGSVRVRVLGDGKALDLGAKGGKDELNRSNGPLTVNVPLAGVKELTLEVEHGEGGLVEDVVNWGNARLVK